MSFSYLKSTGLMIVVVTVFSVLLFMQGESNAKVQGRCDNCHTMHNSQDGVSMVSARGLEGQPAGTDLTCTGCHSEPREELLRLSCIGCHAVDLSGAGAAIYDLGGSQVPQIVYDTSINLAAGNFYYMFFADEPGHNVHGFGADIPPEFVMTANLPVNTPPGYVIAMDPSSVKYFTWNNPPGGESAAPSQILCSGAYGCHGSRETVSQTQAMRGTHHADDTILKFGSIDQVNQGKSLGTSYRYLSGIKGGEDSAWEKNASKLVHNEYFGQTLADVGERTLASQTWDKVDTMSEFCASCHGNFHMVGGGAGEGLSPTNASPWIRHPSDIVIPDSAPYSNFTSYDLTARISRETIPVANSLNSTGLGGSAGGEAQVFCLSCHRAHASSEWDALRFSYSKMITGSTNTGGCLSCHNDKDGL